MNQKLYEISDKYQAVLQIVEDGEMTHEQVADTLESIDGEFDEKAKAVAAQVLNWQANAKSLDEAIKQLQARKKAFESKADSLKGYTLMQMQRLKRSKIETPFYTIKLNAERSKSVEITDIEALDKSLVTEVVTVKPDKKAIGLLLKDGKAVNGAELVVKDTLTIG